jgi:hypothetical protein
VLCSIQNIHNKCIILTAWNTVTSMMWLLYGAASAFT